MKTRLLDLINNTEALNKQQIETFYSTKSKFANAFVINMADRKERFENAKNTLDKVGIEFERFIAINGKRLNEVDPSWSSQFPLLRPGELGCLLSHLCILSLASDHENQNSFTLIFEDDIVTSMNTRQSIDNLMADLELLDSVEPIDIVYLGKCLESCGKMVNIKDNIFRAVAPSCAHALAIKNSYAKYVLEMMDNCDKSVIDREYFNRGIDSILGDFIINGMCNGIVIHPALFFQDVLNIKSDLLLEQMINYQECNDTNPCGEQSHVLDSAGNGKYTEKNTKRDRIVIWILIVVIVLMIISFLIYEKSFAKRFRTRFSSLLKNPTFMACLTILIVKIVLILGVIFYIKRRRIDAEYKRRERAEEFSLPLVFSLTTVKSISGTGPKSFPVNLSTIASREYDTFNPNAVSVDGKVYSSVRCSNGKVSYPIIQIFGSHDLSDPKITFSKKLLIRSNKIVLNSGHFGFEDMRIFFDRSPRSLKKLRMVPKTAVTESCFYLIGVNLDRNINKIPSMVLSKLDSNFNAIQTWHLSYANVNHLPNKNWSPITLPDGELGFIVDIDPLLIVKRKRDKTVFFEQCELAYSAERQTVINRLRNSTITYSWKDVPRIFYPAFSIFADEKPHGYKRYLVMGHSKYCEQDYIEQGQLIMYQHYFVVIDLPRRIGRSGSNVSDLKPIVHCSKPFHIEQETRPHIEYVSGMMFQENFLTIMYGLVDKEAKFINVDSESLFKFFER